MTEAFTHEGFQIMYDEEIVLPQDICDMLRDYYLSMDVLSQMVDTMFEPELHMNPYMATMHRKAKDAVKRWRDRLRDKS